MEEIVSIKNVTKSFYSQKDKFLSFKKKKIEVLNNINLELKKGEITAILGPNGSGKTTLFKLISTLLIPNKGRVNVSGFDTIKNPINVRKVTSFVTSEERSFYFRLTGKQNLLFFATLCNLKKRETLERIKFFSSFLKLDDHINIKYQEYSTGLKQKLNLARGLIRDFSILLLDEPIKSVDPKTSSEILEYFKETLVKKMGKTLIMTTHNIKEIENFADRFIVLNKQSVVADIKKEKIGAGGLSDIYKIYVKN